MGRDAKVISILISIFFFFSGFFSVAISEEPDQTIAGFHLSGFGREGNMTWEISSVSADVFSEQIQLNDFVGTLYGDEKIIVSAKKGDFNKNQNRVHLEDDVVISTESGAELTTEYLDWNRETAEISNSVPVDIKKDNMFITGVGLSGDTNLSKIGLERDVEVKIHDKKKKIIITCSGPLSINYVDNIAVFNREVVVDDGQSQMYSDLMQVFFRASSSNTKTSSFAGRMGEVERIIARGNVKIVREDNVSYSNEAIYNTNDNTLSLTGRPKLIIYSMESQDAFIGN